MNLELRANEKHLCFTLSTSEQEARAEFIRRYGEDPKEIFVFLKMLWVGPIPAQFQFIKQSKPPKETKKTQEKPHELITMF